MAKMIKKTISLDFSKEKVRSHRRGNVLVRSFVRKGDKKDSKENSNKVKLSLGALGLGLGLAAGGTALALNRKPLGKLVGSGNQGKVFRLGDKVTKVYKNKKAAVKEFALLEDLADTGVTPKPIAINGNRVQMEAVGGTNLDDAFKSGMFNSPDSLSNLATNLSDSIKAIHEKGVVHGDLGLDNIIVDKNNKLRIIDLGMGFKPSKLNPNTDLELVSNLFNVLLKDDKQKAKLFSDTLYKRYFNL